MLFHFSRNRKRETKIKKSIRRRLKFVPAVRLRNERRSLKSVPAVRDKNIKQSRRTSMQTPKQNSDRGKDVQ